MIDPKILADYVALVREQRLEAKKAESAIIAERLKIQADPGQEAQVTYQLIIVRSGDGAEFEYGIAVPTLAHCADLINKLDKEFVKWEENGFPKLEANNPLTHYEGCDIYARSSNGAEFSWPGEEGEEGWTEL